MRDDYIFDQQNYINNYIKNSYESLKVRLRKDNALLINKIESVDNVNQYVIDLILKDIYENRVYSFINNDILIDFDLSPKIEKLIKEPSKFLATIQVGVTLSGLLASAVAADSFSSKIMQVMPQSVLNYISADVLSVVILVIITIILSYFTLVFGELVPKRIAMQHSEALSMMAIGVLTFFEKIRNYEEKGRGVGGMKQKFIHIY